MPFTTYIILHNMIHFYPRRKTYFFYPRSDYLWGTGWMLKSSIYMTEE